jgi:hypothetical protein
VVGQGSEVVPSALAAVRSNPSRSWAARTSDEGAVTIPMTRARTFPGWRRHVAEPVLLKTGPPAARVGRVFDGLGRSVSMPEFRGCPFINAAAEFPGQNGPVAEAIQSHRAQVRELFAELLAPLPSSSGGRRRELVDQLVLLYDGTMISAQLDPKSKPHRSAKAAVARLLEDPTAP